MQRAIKLQVHVGKDHIVRLPSEFPEGPAEVIIITAAKAVPAGGSKELSLWADVGDAEYASFSGSVQQLREADQLRTADE
jgi:hypothetical protein